MHQCNGHLGHTERAHQTEHSAMQPSGFRLTCGVIAGSRWDRDGARDTLVDLHLQAKCIPTETRHGNTQQERSGVQVLYDKAAQSFRTITQSQPLARTNPQRHCCESWASKCILCCKGSTHRRPIAGQHRVLHHFAIAASAEVVI